MEELITNVGELVWAAWGVCASLAALLLPWSALAAWIGFWMFGVNWTKFREVLLQGGWVAVALIGLVMVLIWGLVAPPPDGSHHLFGLTVSNFVGKTVYVSALFCIMFLCGSVQLSGCCAQCCKFEDDAAESDSHAAAH